MTSSERWWPCSPPLGTQILQLSAAIAARSGQINAAQLLAELGDHRARFPTPEQLAAEAGVARVTRASGKHRAVTFRWACNKRLRQASLDRLRR